MTTTRILITDGLAKDGIAILQAESTFSVDVRTATSAEELLEIIPQYHALVVRSATKVTAPVIEQGRNLQLICRAGAGVDNVDVAAATAKKLPVMNTASANSLAAAEHTIALLFAMFRQIPQAHQSIREKRWDRAKFSGLEVTGKTLGLIGLGHIGKLVAERALGLAMNVLVYDPNISDATTLPENLKNKVTLKHSLNDILVNSNVITVHVPLLSSTKNLLSKEMLSLLKPGSFVLNCARGGIIDESGLCDLLDSGHLAGAAFDVFDSEPIVFPNRLAEHPKVIVTPHLGASTAEAQLRVGTTAAQQILGFFKRNERLGVLN
jgi:D-3-phosphoglycerate dehydrogenase